MAVIVSFIHDRNGEQSESVFSTAANDFTRDDLLNKFISWMQTLGYIFPEEAAKCCGKCEQCEPHPDDSKFEME